MNHNFLKMMNCCPVKNTLSMGLMVYEGDGETSLAEIEYAKVEL
jgi:hypothetical protein